MYNLIHPLQSNQGSIRAEAEAEDHQKTSVSDYFLKVYLESLHLMLYYLIHSYPEFNFFVFDATCAPTPCT